MKKHLAYMCGVLVIIISAVLYNKNQLPFAPKTPSQQATTQRIEPTKSTAITHPQPTAKQTKTHKIWRTISRQAAKETEWEVLKDQPQAQPFILDKIAIQQIIPGDFVELTVPDYGNVRINIERIKQTRYSKAWWGRIENEPQHHAVFTYTDKESRGLITTPIGNYHIKVKDLHGAIYKAPKVKLSTGNKVVK